MGILKRKWRTWFTFVLGNFGKRRRSLHAPAASEDASKDKLKAAVREQQQLLSTIRKDLEHLRFIVDHLNQDAKCILDSSAGEISKMAEDQLSLLSYGLIESSVMERAALESELRQLRGNLESLNSEHKILIEQQVSSEEAMMDELARLMTENEQLKKRSAPVVELEVQELESLVASIETAVQPTQVVNAFESLKERINCLEEELRQREAHITKVEAEKEQFAEVVQEKTHQLQTREQELSVLTLQLEQMQAKVSDGQILFLYFFIRWVELKRSVAIGWIN